MRTNISMTQIVLQFLLSICWSWRVKASELEPRIQHAQSQNSANRFLSQMLIDAPADRNAIEKYDYPFEILRFRFSFDHNFHMLNWDRAGTFSTFTASQLHKYFQHQDFDKRITIFIENESLFLLTLLFLATTRVAYTTRYYRILLRPPLSPSPSSCSLCSKRHWRGHRV